MPCNSDMFLRSDFKNVKIDEEDEFICQCGYRMKEFSVRKKRSPYYGLQFYACTKHSADPTRCHSQIWSDENERVRSLIPPAMRSPRTPRKQVDIRTFGQYTAPSTLKRKAEVGSFGSVVGDMTDNEQASPLTTRPAKRVRCGYVDAATQTGESEIISAVASRTAPPSATGYERTARPIPRRRLFDEYLAVAKAKPAAFDLFAPQTREHSITDQGPSLPTTPTRERPRQSLSPPRTPMTGPGSRRTKSVSFSIDGYPRSPPPHIREPTTPQSTQDIKLGLISPIGYSPQPSHRHRPTELGKPALGKPTKSSSHCSQPQSQHRARVNPPENDSDDEIYGWDEDLDQTMLEVMETVEKRSNSPFFA
ncbi:hypothetical protein BDW66DRAFT_143204 [Aspergillus desertorum]